MRLWANLEIPGVRAGEPVHPVHTYLRLRPCLCSASGDDRVEEQTVVAVEGTAEAMISAMRSEQVMLSAQICPFSGLL